ncbi:uncharacterized protein BDW47DRAFT_25957 [Aspergillus candidus]|uniref:RanBP2-type domain-containing protein n=1 Tax=Aspergillus candidus TaxID=41067 RepID=A0A2I2FNL1_ASPCN|nr:hypothetical protein BDW47DRAFT_25957 [Aspergillus candidus]PLB42221.1 hypothetical protein BDW47DRAFT_25957 [Aspergillus candidus]
MPPMIRYISTSSLLFNPRKTERTMKTPSLESFDILDAPQGHAHDFWDDGDDLRDIKQLGNDWFCCVRTCKAYNKSNLTVCNECKHSKCAECQYPIQEAGIRACTLFYFCVSLTYGQHCFYSPTSKLVYAISLLLVASLSVISWMCVCHDGPKLYSSQPVCVTCNHTCIPECCECPNFSSEVP